MHMLGANTIKLPCSILYQRGIYPSDSFEQQKQYGLSIMVSTDEGLTGYLTTVLRQMSGAAPAPLNSASHHAASPCCARQRQASAAVSWQPARQQLLVQRQQADSIVGTAGHGLSCSIPAEMGNGARALCQLAQQAVRPRFRPALQHRQSSGQLPPASQTSSTSSNASGSSSIAVP